MHIDFSYGRVARDQERGLFLRRQLPLGCALLVALGGCDGNGATDDTQTGGAPAAGTNQMGAGATGGGGTGAAPTGGSGGAGTGGSPGGSGTGGSGTGGSTGGSSGGTGATSGTGGTATGGTSALGGTTGRAGRAAGGTGGGMEPAGMGGMTGTSGTGMGGMSAGGSAGRGMGGSGNVAGAGGDTSGCTRDLLKNTIDLYFTALAAHDSTLLPLGDGVKFTENGKVLKLGQDGLWKTAGMLKHVHSALDTQICQTASEAVVPDGNMDIPYALRLKVENQKITEVESIAVRPGDYKVSGSNFASDTGAIISSAKTIGWEDTVPDDQRATRDELVAWMDKYFKYFPNGVCNTDSSCKRLENGGGSFSCSAGASCSTGSAPAKPQAVSHILLGDVETGVGAGFDLFTGADVDMHMFKMKGGKVYAVDAVLGAGTSTGWE